MATTGQQANLFDCRHPGGPVAEAVAILDCAVATYRPVKMFGLFSGGHDSLCAVHVASRHPLFVAAVHINTGIGVEQTREFVRQTCFEQGWSLIEMCPPPGSQLVPPRKRRPGIDYERLPAYDALVLTYGFPGPAGHQVMYTRLKERCLRRLVREQKVAKKDRILLVGGMRLAESVRRMGNTEPHSRDGCRVWCSPILHWSDEDKHRYIGSAGLAKNPVVGKLCMSGECLCGAFAKPGEIVEIRHHFPEAAQRIAELEARARDVGVHSVWGTRPPRCPSQSPAGATAEPPSLFGLCWSCANQRNTEE